MNTSPYSIHRQFFRYYIVPTCEFIDGIPYHNNYLSFWFRNNAEIVCKAMNAAFREGYRYNSYFGEKS